MSEKTDNTLPIRAAILAVKNAFGAPGDYGYGTKQGAALHGLYDVFNTLVAEVLLDDLEQREAGPSLERRLVECLQSIVDTPILTIRDVMGNHQSPLDLYLGSFLPDQANEAASLLEEAGR